MAIESWYKDSLRREGAAVDAKRATERLLSGLCDAVVRLGPSMQIVNATPQFLHLVCPDMPINRAEVEGAHFSNFLATPADKNKFVAFISTNTSADSSETMRGTAPALHVNLCHSAGREVSVQLFHVFSEGLDSSLEHLIGICWHGDLRMEGSSPDESLCRHSSGDLGASSSSGTGTLFDALWSEGGGERAQTKKRHVKASRASSMSSGSSAHKNMEYQKRKLSDLDTVRLKISIPEFELQEYTLCFNDPSNDQKRPDLESCLVGGLTEPSTQRLQDGINTIIYKGMRNLDIDGELLFRPPTAACASSKVLLCAQSVKLILPPSSSSDSDTSDEESDKGCPVCSQSSPGDDSQCLILHFCNVSQIIAYRQVCAGASQRSRHSLTALSEANEGKANS